MMADGSVLVIRLSALGDVLFTLPAVHALRTARPGIAIDWVVEDRAASLLDLYPGIRQRIVWHRSRIGAQGHNPLHWPAAAAALVRHAGALRHERYDAILDFQGNLKSGMHLLLARGGRRLGLDRAHSREGNWLLRREQVMPPPDALHRVELAQAIVRALVPELPATPAAPPLTIPAASRDFAEQALRESGLVAAPFLVLHPGTSAFGAFKRWQPERFSALADLLFTRRSLRSLVTWGPGEEELARKVVAVCKQPSAIVAPRTRSLPDLAALLVRARLAIASDSAALHLAAFLGTPVVALYGPKDPRRYGPRFAPSRVVHTWLPCSPCRRRTCPDVLCMEEISIRQVFEATEELLNEEPST